MTKQKWPKLNVFYIALGWVWLVLFFVLALRTFFSDSEIWGLTLSQQIFHPEGMASIYYKYSFHLLTYVFSHFAPSEEGVYFAARAGWAAVGGLSAWLLARLFARVHERPHWTWPLFVFLITASLFVNQGFRIRADILSLLMHTLYLNFFFSLRHREIRKRDFAILTCIHIILILSTPKFIIFSICQTVLCWGWAQSSERRKSLIWLLAVTIFTPFIAACGIALLLTAIGKSQLVTSATVAVDFYLKTFDPTFFNPVLYSAVDFYHFFKLYLTSQVHALILSLWLIGFFVLIFKKKAAQVRPESRLQIYATLLFLFVISYNQKLPFFLGAFLAPVLAQAFCFALKALEAWRPQWQEKTLLLIVVTSSMTGAYNFRENWLFNSNTPQRDMIRILDAYVSQHPEVKIYDIIGVLPRKTHVFAFIGPGEVAQKDKIIEKIMAESPDLILIVYKFKYLEPDFPPLLQKHWVPVANNVWAKGRFISVRETPTLFSQITTINGVIYWVMPYPKERFYFSDRDHKLINGETLMLDDQRRVTQIKPVYLAVPQSRLSLILSDVPPTGLPYNPTLVFRFDTSF